MVWNVENSTERERYCVNPSNLAHIIDVLRKSVTSSRDSEKPGTIVSVAFTYFLSNSAKKLFSFSDSCLN